MGVTIKYSKMFAKNIWACNNEVSMIHLAGICFEMETSEVLAQRPFWLRFSLVSFGRSGQMLEWCLEQIQVDSFLYVSLCYCGCVVTKVKQIL